MREIVIATKNKHKVLEFENMLKKMDYKVLSLFDFDHLPDIEETGKTFKENALIKARTLSKYLNKTVIADDSGLCVRALNNEPGVYSARYAGLDKDYHQNNQLLMKNIKNEKDRFAKFVSSICVYYPSGDSICVEGYLEGEIIDEYRGSNGFGYDPIFYLPSLNKTLAELDMEEKNKLSHRANALKKIIKYL